MILETDKKPFVTGTAVYGPFTEKSDIDIVMYYYDAERLKNKLSDAGFEIKEPQKMFNPIYEGFVFDMGGRDINIICVANKTEYHQWKYMTNELLLIQKFQIEKQELTKQIN